MKNHGPIRHPRKDEVSATDVRVKFADGTTVLYPAGTPSTAMPGEPDDLHAEVTALQREKSRALREQNQQAHLDRVRAQNEARARDRFLRNVSQEVAQ